jgi:hypothetical protein
MGEQISVVMAIISSHVRQPGIGDQRIQERGQLIVPEIIAIEIVGRSAWSVIDL